MDLYESMADFRIGEILNIFLALLGLPALGPSSYDLNIEVALPHSFNKNKMFHLYSCHCKEN